LNCQQKKYKRRLEGQWETNQDTKRDHSVRFSGARFAEKIKQMISGSEGQFGKRPKNTYQRGSRVLEEAAQSLGWLTHRQQGLMQRAKEASAEHAEAQRGLLRGRRS